MSKRAVAGDFQAFETAEALLSCALEVGKVVLGALSRETDFRRGGFASSQAHDAILCGTNSGGERLLEIVAADGDEPLAFGLALAAIGLVALGLPWWGALAILALVSLLGAGICVWLALRAFEDTTFKATRRQLARLHLADDPDEVERDPEAMP